MTDNGNSTSVPATIDRSAANQLEMAKRQAILMRLINDEERKGRRPTQEKLAELMRSNQWISARWPGYNGNQVRYDFNKIMALTRDDLKILAMPYLARQLNIIDETTDTLKNIVDDKNADDDTRIKAANALRGYTGEIAKIFALYAPKETHIKKQELTGTIDDFERLRKQAEKELSGLNESVDDDEYVDGEYDEA